MSSESKLDNQDKIAIALDCWYVTGATASGKSKVSLELARQLDGEIISLDSMAIYRGMDIGTAKVSTEIRGQIPHHLIDILEPTDNFSVTQYREAALEAITNIRDRGKQAIFVGGSALYLKAMLRGIFDGPPADPEFRSRVEAELKDVPIEELHKRLQQVDPISAQKLHPHDQRRIIRALEVYHSTGEPISHLQNEFERSHAPDQCNVFTLRHPRSVLHQRIQDRVESMFQHGLVAEVQQLLERFGSLSKTASQAVGYREVIDHLQGQQDLARTQELVLFRTRQFARHQETWFRGLPECQMLDIPDHLEDKLMIQWLVENIVNQGHRR